MGSALGKTDFLCLVHLKETDVLDHTCKFFTIKHFHETNLSQSMQVKPLKVFSGSYTVSEFE